MCTGYIQQYKQELPRSQNSYSTPAQTSEYHKLWAKTSIRTHTLSLSFNGLVPGEPRLAVVY